LKQRGPSFRESNGDAVSTPQLIRGLGDRLGCMANGQATAVEHVVPL
jgi:hypothetical protein